MAKTYVVRFERKGHNGEWIKRVERDCTLTEARYIVADIKWNPMFRNVEYMTTKEYERETK